MTYHPAAYLHPFFAVECRLLDADGDGSGPDPHPDAWWCVGIYESRTLAEESDERRVLTGSYEYRIAEVKIERVRVLEPVAQEVTP